MKRKIHFIGVGGIGMSGLAEILINLGYDVSGSDLQASDITARLESLGLRFSEGHEEGLVGEADIVVISAAVPEDNVEAAEARRRGVPVIHRSDLLADLIRLKPNAVVVAGSHGKTTTTSMMSAIFDRADIGATSVVGGILHRSGTNARWGTGDYIVAEADEHDGSFLRLHPTIALVTNIDAEHLEYYRTMDRLKKAFTDFCNGVPFYGCAILCWDDKNARSILPDIESVSLTYGLSEGASIQAANLRLENPIEEVAPNHLGSLRTCFDVECMDERLAPLGSMGTVTLRALGRDNVRNALATITVGLRLGMSFDIIADGLRQFEGVRRRLQVCGEKAGVTVVEDYAHHPTEIASTLEAARWTQPKRIICVFQPHLYSRTKFFTEDFAAALATVDLAIVTDIYASREQPIPGVDAGQIVDAARRLGADQVEWVREMRDVPSRLVPELECGDLVLLLGAGDINRLASELLAELEASE